MNSVNSGLYWLRALKKLAASRNLRASSNLRANSRRLRRCRGSQAGPRFPPSTLPAPFTQRSLLVLCVFRIRVRRNSPGARPMAASSSGRDRGCWCRNTEPRSVCNWRRRSVVRLRCGTGGVRSGNFGSKYTGLSRPRCRASIPCTRSVFLRDTRGLTTHPEKVLDTMAEWTWSQLLPGWRAASHGVANSGKPVSRSAVRKIRVHWPLLARKPSGKDSVI